MSNEFKILQRKILLRTTGRILCVTAILLAVYVIFLRGHIADTVVGLGDRFLYHDYEQALEAYQRFFRLNNVFFIAFLFIVIFVVVLGVYLKEFTKYFNEINQGIDSLVDEQSEDIRLSEELEATEQKINSIRHTLAQRKAATELEEKRRKELVVYLAHDLKTPLTSVIGYLNLLQDQKEIKEEERKKYLSIALKKAERLEELINEFFDVTRFHLSRITLEYSRVNLTRMLEQITYEFQPQLEEKGLECILECPPDVSVNCDVNKIQRVFDNLLRNAVNYSYEHGTIRVCVTQEEAQVTICFTNPGEHIPEEKLESLFEQFYRVDDARASKSGGAGLGLAIAREIVEAHGGTIRAESTGDQIELEVMIPAMQEKR
ncbi:MAG: HAMP domain-containing histidine kinase [Lachnospiraceae bacterium]|nr:HAMP domain-containing histidine kinase [Lachnospiraceae bacterium]